MLDVLGRKNCDLGATGFFATPITTKPCVQASNDGFDHPYRLKCQWIYQFLHLCRFLVKNKYFVPCKELIYAPELG